MALHPNTQQTETAAPVGDATTNRRQGSVVQVEIEPRALLYLNLHTGELLEVPKAEITGFENECRRMHSIAQQYLDANAALSTVLEEWSAVLANPQASPTQTAQAEAAIAEARTKQESAHQQLREEIKPLGKLNERDVRLVELLPLMSRTYGGLPVKGADGQPVKRIAGFKTAYVRSDKIKSHWRSYKLSKADIHSGHESILSKDANGKTKIDSKKLLGQIKEAKVKTSWLNTLLDGETTLQISGTLTDWAVAWNQNLKWSSQGKLGPLDNHVNLSAQAQLMRYFAGVGGDAEWEPSKGRVALKAEGRAEFAVAEGTAGCELFFPSKTGLQLALYDLQRKEHPLGSIRFRSELKLYGTVGASVVGELALTTDYKDEKKGEWGVRGTPAAKRRGSAIDKLNLSEKPTDPAAVAELEVFAGAQGDISLRGSMEWLHVQETKGKFEPFASVAPALGVQAGAGLGGYLELSYIEGKFRFRAKAAACLGLGAKGRLELEVGVKHIGSFMKWFYYALYNANYNNLSFVSERTFRAVNMIYVVAIAKRRRLEEVLKEMFNDNLALGEFKEFLVQLEREENRVQLMNNVLANPELLRYSPPEARGMLLYQLTRHSSVSKADLRNWDSFEVMSKRKRAVIKVIKQAQTQRDYQNMLQHMHPQASKSNIWEHAEASLLQFLELGLGDSEFDDELRKYVKKLSEKSFVTSLHKEPARGYAVVENDTMQYAMLVGDHPNFASGGWFAILNDSQKTLNA